MHTRSPTDALLYERLAWAHAVAGHAVETERALEAAQSALAEYDNTPQPDWAAWVGRGMRCRPVRQRSGIVGKVPGEHGLVVPAFNAPVLDGADGSTEPGDMADWRTDAERAGGGAVVRSLDRLPEVLDEARLLGSGTTCGGFVPMPA